MGKKKGYSKTPAPKKPPLTHFLCLPLVTPTSRPQLDSSLRAFRDDLSAKNSKFNENAEKESDNKVAEQETVLPFVHPKAIRPVGALHCTLGVMSLDKEKLSETIGFLQSVESQTLFRGASGNTVGLSKTAGEVESPVASRKTNVSNERSEDLSSLERPITPPAVDRASEMLKVSLKGLESMHTPRKTSILYIAPSDAAGKLYPVCLALQKMFKDKGFLVEDNRQLKLHATIVNTIYAKGRKRTHQPYNKQRTPEPAASGKTPGEHTDKGQGQGDKTFPTDAGSTEPIGEVQDKSQGHGPNANAPLKIDATAILEKYKDYVWAKDVVLDRVAICEMGAKKILDGNGNVIDEEYTEVASIALPS